MNKSEGLDWPVALFKLRLVRAPGLTVGPDLRCEILSYTSSNRLSPTKMKLTAAIMACTALLLPFTTAGRLAHEMIEGVEGYVSTRASSSDDE